jgi:NAD+ synthase
MMFVIIMTQFYGQIPVIDANRTLRNISNFIEYSLIESNAQGLVMGLSGGLDSSITAMISAQVVNKEKILGLIMPTKSTPPDDVEDALKIAETIGIQYKVINIETILEPFKDICRAGIDEEHTKIAQGNLKARIRMTLLYYHANSLNRLVVGTGNRTELLIGYFTKYGDGGSDIFPIGGLYKTDVRQIAQHLKMDPKILDKMPSAGLWPGQTDEEEIGIKYEQLDQILYLLTEKNMAEDEVVTVMGIDSREVVRVNLMMHEAQHKLQTPPIANIER